MTVTGKVNCKVLPHEAPTRPPILSFATAFDAALVRLNYLLITFGQPRFLLGKRAFLGKAALQRKIAFFGFGPTNAFMKEAYQLLDCWGFQAKTFLTWDKVNVGLGEWLRNVTEHCILAVRGRPVVKLINQTTLLREKRREHSRKPEAFYALVDSLCVGRRLDYFGREQREGWGIYGVESAKFGA